MDKLDQFIKNKTGVGIDTDGYYGNQCMDLMHEYCRTVLGLTDLRVLAAANAESVYVNFSGIFGNQLFERIPNTPAGIPQKGDIMLYDWGVDGHVDVFVQGDVNNFRSFGQNWPYGKLPAIVNHPNYDGVLGWLRYKGPSPVISTTGGLPPNYGDIVQGSSNWDEVKKLGYLSIAALKLKLDQADSHKCQTYPEVKESIKKLTDDFKSDIETELLNLK